MLRIRKTFGQGRVMASRFRVTVVRKPVDPEAFAATLVAAALARLDATASQNSKPATEGRIARIPKGKSDD
jgi:hypothetical protein